MKYCKVDLVAILQMKRLLHVAVSSLYSDLFATYFGSFKVHYLLPIYTRYPLTPSEGSNLIPKNPRDTDRGPS